LMMRIQKEILLLALCNLRKKSLTGAAGAGYLR
jgi:hypothetical protein